MTVKTGYSLAELVLSPEPIDDAGIERPAGLVVLSADGRKQALAYLQGDGRRRARLRDAGGGGAAVGRVRSRRSTSRPETKRVARDASALAVTAAAVLRLGLVPAEALMRPPNARRRVTAPRSPPASSWRPPSWVAARPAGSHRLSFRSE